MHRHTAGGHEEVERLQFTATQPGGSGQRTSCNAPPDYLRVVGNVGLQSTATPVFGKG